MVIARIPGIRLEVAFGIEQGNEVVQSDHGRNPLCEYADSRHGIVDVALEQARNEYHIGQQAREKRFTYPLSNLTTPIIAVFAFAHRLGAIPDPDIFLWQQIVKLRADRFDG